MSQRRTPIGGRPARRPGQPGRPSVRAAGRRESGPRAPVVRTPSTHRGDSPRSANRPAVARRATAGGAAKRTSAPQPRRFTGRATILCAVLVALALAYTYPVREYLNQQSEIARLEAEQADQRARIAALAEQAELWKDEEYIKIQARERFYMVMPGEKPLLVLFDPEGAARDAGGDPRVEQPQPTQHPWYDTLWSSIEAANQEEGAAR